MRFIFRRPKYLVPLVVWIHENRHEERRSLVGRVHLVPREFHAHEIARSLLMSSTTVAANLLVMAKALKLIRYTKVWRRQPPAYRYFYSIHPSWSENLQENIDDITIYYQIQHEKRIEERLTRFASNRVMASFYAELLRNPSVQIIANKIIRDSGRQRGRDRSPRKRRRLTRRRLTPDVLSYINETLSSEGDAKRQDSR